MKTRMRSPLLVAALLAAGVALSGAAMARGGGCPEGPRGDHAERVGTTKERHDQRVGERLDELATSLQLRDEQRPVWERFRERVEAQRVKRTPRALGEAAMSAPERLHRMEKAAEARLESLRRLREATEALYAVLDDAQRKAFDAHRHPPSGAMHDHGQGRQPRQG